MRYDLLKAGYRLEWLGTDRLSWLDMVVLFTYQEPKYSAVATAIHGDFSRWDLSDYLLAAAVDGINAGNWQRAGGKGRRPKPIPRPKDKLHRQLRPTSLKRNPLQSGSIGKGQPWDIVVQRLKEKNGR